MSTSASKKAEDWKAITPAALIAPVEHIRKMFDEAVWKCSRITEKLCFAALHPEDKQVDLGPYESSFVAYRNIIGPVAAQKFDKGREVGTPPAIFDAFLQIMAAGIRSEIDGLFSELLQIGIAHSAELNEHPVEWAKAHSEILIKSKRHVVKLWTKSVCDKQDYSKAGNSEQQIEDLLFWRDWRAPKLIYMQPSGNLPYEASSAWNRDDEALTDRLLESLSSRFMQFLLFYVDKIAGQAHVDLAKTGTVTAAVGEKVDGNSTADTDRRFAAMAIEEAQKSVPEDDRPHPKVGAVVVKDGKVLTKAHRGERPKPKSHAEYIALEAKLPDDLVAGATVYTTLEPCTTRKHPKIPCAQRLIDRRVACIVIGMLDPNPDISGKGWQALRDAGIEIRVFDHDLMQICEEINREFIRAQRKRQVSVTTTPTTSNHGIMAARSVIDATRNLQKAAWSFFAIHTKFGVARAARDVAEEEKEIFLRLDAALSVLAQDYDFPVDLSPVVQNELANINIALVNLKAFSMTGQTPDVEIAAIQIQDACERIRMAAKPYAYRA